MFRRKTRKCSCSRETLRPVIRSSICTGEKVAGCNTIQTGTFSAVLLIRNSGDLQEFLDTYDISETDVATDY